MERKRATKTSKNPTHPGKRNKHTRDDTTSGEVKSVEYDDSYEVKTADPGKRCRRAAAVKVMKKLKYDSEDEKSDETIDFRDTEEQSQEFDCNVQTVSTKRQLKTTKSKSNRKYSGDDKSNEDNDEDESNKEQEVNIAVKAMTKLKCDSKADEQNIATNKSRVKSIKFCDTQQQSEESPSSVATVSTKTKQETAKSKPKEPCQRKGKGADDDSERHEKMDRIEEDGEELSDGEDENKPCDTPIDYKDLEWYHTTSRVCQVCETKYATFNEASDCITKNHGRLRCYVCLTFWRSTNNLYKHYTNVHRVSSIKRNTIICNMCSKSVPFQEVSYHMVKHHMVGIEKAILKSKVRTGLERNITAEGYDDVEQQEASITTPKDVVSKHKASSGSSSISSKYKTREIKDNEAFEDVKDEEIAEREDQGSDEEDEEESDYKDEEESDYEDEEESDVEESNDEDDKVSEDEENGPGKEDEDYGDTIWYYASSKECQKCGKKYDTCREASKCITQNHGRIRCYICFRFWRNTGKLFQHYSEDHVVAKRKPNRITCPLCLKSVSFEIVSIHMIECHIAPTEKNRDDKSQNSESDFDDE